MAESDVNGIAVFARKLVESVTYLGIAGLGFVLAVSIIEAVTRLL